MKENKLRKLIMAMSIFFVALAGVGIVYSVAQIDTVSVMEIDYEELTLTVKGNKEDSKIFFANKKNASTWDEIPGELDENKQITMDISWISASSNYSLYLKGDKTKEPLKVVIPKQNKKFTAKLNTLENKFSFTNKGLSTDVYWRKSTSTEWKKYDEKEMSKLLENFSLKGISLVFCTGQVKGTSVTNVGERPSKAYAVKIVKRANAPSVSLDYKTMTFAVGKTMEYKLSTDGSDKWKNITATTLHLDEVLPCVMYDAYKELVQAGTIEEGEKFSIDFRTKATSKKVASQIQTIEVPGQKETKMDNIIFGYTGSKQCEIKIKELEIDKEHVLAAASPTNVYEYAVVEEGQEFNVYEAEWKSIVSETVKISSKTAPENSTIYIRKQGTGKDLPTKAVVLIEKIQYLTAASLDKEVNFEKIQGVQKDLTFDMVVSSMEAEIASITFNGVAVGFKTSEPVEMEIEDSGKKYVITATINDTTELEKISDNIATNMKATITMNNTEIITKGVNLYIQRAATQESKTYVKYRGMHFFDSDTEKSEIAFDITLNKSKEIGEDIRISSVTYNGKELVYSTVKKEDTIAVTIKKEQMKDLDGYVEQRNYGKEISVVVKLSNGEELSRIKIKIVSPVKISGETSSYGVSISSYNDYLERYAKAIEANKNSETGVVVEVPTDYQDPVITYTLNKDVLNRDSTYQFVSLTWNGESVLKQELSQNGAYTVTVSLKQLTSLGKTGSANLVLTLENAEKERLIVDYGYQITVTN